MTENTKNTIIPIYHLPKAAGELTLETRRLETPQGDIDLQYPVLTPSAMDKVVNVVKEGRVYLSRLRVDQIIEKIDLAIQKWLNPDYPIRQIAEDLLPSITGYDSEMILLELKQNMRNFRKKELLRFLDEEFDQPAMLDEFRPRKSGGMSMAIGPELIFHVFSGNVPGVQIWSLIMGLLVKSANIGKTSFSEPLLPVLFTQSLSEVDPQLGNAIAILPWSGGTQDLEDPMITAADTIVVYGSDRTVQAIKPRVPVHKRMLTFGHKISFAMIGREALSADKYLNTLYRLTEDVAVYDQQSCMAPQTIFVEKGGTIDPKGFAQALASELIRYQQKRPRAILSDAEAMAIQNLRTTYEIQSMEDPRIAVFTSSNDTSATVVYHDQPGFEGSPLNRSIHVFAVESLESALTPLKAYQHFLQSCGLAVAPNRLFDLAKQLGEWGVNRVTSVGQMNHAQSGWHHDGRFNLLDLVQFIDIERGVEEALEKYDPDVEVWR